MQLLAHTRIGRSRHFRRERGFSILELAITLLIMALLASAALVPFVAQVTQRKITATERILDQAAEALIGYATATGRLPCPATAASNGRESFAGGGNAANGDCTVTITGGVSHFIGFLPAVTLGFTPIDAEGYAIDGWGGQQNRIRYAVSNQTVNGIGNPFTRVNGMRAASGAAIASAPLLFVCASATSSAAAETHCGPGALGSGGSGTLTANAPAVLWSSGANAATGGTGADEAQNPSAAGGSADRIFVSRIRTDVAGNAFDDIVTWLSVGNLVSRMVMGGQLP